MKTKHSLPSPFVVVSNHSVYMVFLDPQQGNDDFAFFLPTSKKLMWSSCRDEYDNILAFIKSKQGSKEKDVILLDKKCACVWNMYMVANLILLYSLKPVSLD